MAKSEKQCIGKTASGNQCSRGATVGNYCKSHAQDKGPARDPRVRGGKKKKKDRPAQEYVTIFDKAVVRMNDESIPPGVQVQWARLATDCIRLAKEEKRLLDGMGAGVAYEFKIVPPPPGPTPSEDAHSVDSGASEGDSGDGDKRVLN
jgi:hypothetical protein